MPHLSDKTMVHCPPAHEFREEGIEFFLDAEKPHWIAVDAQAAGVLRDIGNGRPFGELVLRYASREAIEPGKAWLHVHDFVQAALACGFLSPSPIERSPYEGRARHAAPDGLRELWLHTNNSCNLACAHCLVNSAPGGTPGLAPPEISRIVEEALAMDVERFYLTGGEPFLRPDVFDLIRRITEAGRELVVLTNATLFRGPRGLGLGTLSREKVRFQVSLDGATPGTNDPIRGEGTFSKALEGVALLSGLGFEVSLTSVVTSQNLRELPELTRLAADTGARSQHLMWSHRRGRARASDNGFFPETADILAAVLRTADEAARLGVRLDNLEAARRRADGQPGVKYDLGNAGWDSLCVYADGTVYPSAALANHPPLACGRVTERPLAAIFESSPVLGRFRNATLARRPQVLADPFRFLTGGGDIEHAYVFSCDGEEEDGDLAAPDPYYPISTALVRRAMREAAQARRAAWNRRSGYDVPALYHAMGDGSIACGVADGAAAEMPVLTLHSNCVLSFDVDKPRALVREYYARAAEAPQPELCCPTGLDPAETAHIPAAVVDRFYGCGSPVSLAQLSEGETFLDLGSGAGIDVFIASRKVGASGRAIGVDMTDAMLAVAEENRPLVARNLGYDAVEFRKGFLEAIPAEDRSVDAVTSNCVVNLSPDKAKVFSEIWRILKDHGRVVIADIVSAGVVPPHLKANPDLWGECLAGALTGEGLLAALERAGFYGVEVVRKAYWKSVEGYPFYSMTVRGWKFEKTAGCVYRGQRAVYLGPGKALLDEEGHTFPRGLEVEICTDTAAKLSRMPYAASFQVIEPAQDGSLDPVGRGAPGETCAPGCC